MRRDHVVFAAWQCVMEAFTFLHAGANLRRITILPLVEAHDDAHHTAAVRAVRGSFSEFDVRSAQCYSSDRDPLLAAVECGFHSHDAFNAAFRKSLLAATEQYANLTRFRSSELKNRTGRDAASHWRTTAAAAVLVARRSDLQAKQSDVIIGIDEISAHTEPEYTEKPRSIKLNIDDAMAPAKAVAAGVAGLVNATPISFKRDLLEDAGADAGGIEAQYADQSLLRL